MQDKSIKREYLTLPEYVDMSQKWRIESMKRRLCWVYHFLNVALPFTVASSCVGERACTCISACHVGVCLQMCVFCTKCVGVSMGLSALADVALWFSVCLDGLRTDVGARHFKKPMSKTFSSVSDVCIVCRRSCRVTNKWSDRGERRMEGETLKHGENKVWHYSCGRKHISQKMSTNSSCRRVCVLQMGALVVQTEKIENFYRHWINRHQQWKDLWLYFPY